MSEKSFRTVVTLVLVFLIATQVTTVIAIANPAPVIPVAEPVPPVMVLQEIEQTTTAVEAFIQASKIQREILEAILARNIALETQLEARR